MLCWCPCVRLDRQPATGFSLSSFVCSSLRWSCGSAYSLPLHSFCSGLVSCALLLTVLGYRRVTHVRELLLCCRTARENNVESMTLQLLGLGEPSCSFSPASTQMNSIMAARSARSCTHRIPYLINTKAWAKIRLQVCSFHFQGSCRARTRILRIQNKTPFPTPRLNPISSTQVIYVVYFLCRSYKENGLYSFSTTHPHSSSTPTGSLSREASG